jgi:hypothetical protein
MEKKEIREALDLIKRGVELLEMTLSKKEPVKRNFIQVGDVMMKDFNVLKPWEAKTRVQDVLGIVFSVSDIDIKIIAERCSGIPYLTKTVNDDYSSDLSVEELKSNMNGLMNTNVMISCMEGTFPMLEYCMDYSRFTLDKGMWYIPAIGELYKIFKYKEILNKTLEYLGFNRIYEVWYASSNATPTQTYVFDMEEGCIHTNNEVLHMGFVLPCLSLVYDEI